MITSRREAGFRSVPPGTSPGRRLHGRRILAALAFGVSICGLGGGCGDRDLPTGTTKKAVAFSDVPSELVGAAKKEMPGVEFNEAWQNLDPQGKLHSYEIRGKQPSNGKTREVRVSLEGAILESE